MNIVGSGELSVELDLTAVSTELGNVSEYDPEMYPGVYVRLGSSQPLITLYRTGKYIITGADSETDLNSTRSEFLELLHDHRIIPTPEDDWFQIQNCVCVAETGEKQNLSALAIGLGLEVTEYEPEQFPGLIYRPPEHECVILVFASGKLVITGAKNIEEAESAVKDFSHQAAEFT